LRLEDLKLFRDVAMARSLSRGAELNGVTQSAVSQHLKDLEETLGVQLLDRSRRPLLLTAAGRCYLAFCENVVAEQAELERSLDRFRSAVEGPVLFATIYSVGLSEVAGLRAEFTRRFPKAQLVVEYLRPEKIYEAVLSERADLGVVSYPTSNREIEVVPWRNEEMVVAVAPGHPLAGLPALHPMQLEGLDFIGFDPDLPVQRHIDRFLRQQRVTVNRLMHFDNLDSIREAVSHGSGVSIVPKPVLKSFVEQGRIVAIPILPKSLRRPLGIIHRRRKVFSRGAQAFLSLLMESALPVRPVEKITSSLAI